MQRISQLQSLSHDHHHALVLARRCRVSASAANEQRTHEVWEQVRVVFARDLEPHFQIEEACLLPALEQAGQQPLVDRIRVEHAALRDLAGIAFASAGEVERFGILLDAHVRYEEREVFETAQTCLSADALERIAEACRNMPRGVAG
ncbi:MAG TPA: hemerythrin domain-containing protein [Candidatus Limnocylindrales bacterium]|nr:hemerythrin domain-containing protein [Candidatus Limnocylindrales bacterium]